MESNKPSMTALGAASHRYFHQLFDGLPKILEDTVTPKLLDSGIVEYFRKSRADWESPFSLALRSHILLRSRYSEDCLIESGIHQVVILGAGFDTFAYRQPPSTASVHIFEVDHPSTQKMKQERLSAGGVQIPQNLTHVPIDFEKQELLDVLTDHGFDTTQAAFFSWLGVTMYLTEDAIDAVLQLVGKFAKGTQLVLTYTEPSESSSRNTLLDRVKEQGEPLVSFFTPEEIERKLREFGFSEVTVPSPAYLATLFDGRADGLTAPRRIGIMRATV